MTTNVKNVVWRAMLFTLLPYSFMFLKPKKNKGRLTATFKNQT